MKKLDVMDAEQMEKYECALLNVKNAKKPTGTAAEILKGQCQVVKDFFTTIFGEEILKEDEVLKGWNYKKHFELMANFIQETSTAFAEENKKIDEVAAKYTANRAARR